MVKISIVVPVYNSQATIEKCLDSLIRQSFKDYEIILVDNGCSDASTRLIREFIKAHPEAGIKLVREEKKGPSQARNRGIEESSAGIIAFTDSDCVADVRWLEELVASFDDEKIAAVAGSIQGFEPGNLIQEFLSVFTLKSSGEDKIFSEFTLLEGGFASANLAAKKDWLKKIKGFVGGKYGEDFDLCARLYELGLKIRYVSSARVYHIHRNTLCGLVEQSFGFGRAHARLLRRWGAGKLIIEFPQKTYENAKFFFPCWLNLNYADKKMLFFFLWGFLNPVLFVLPGFYFIYLCLSLKRKFGNEGKQPRLSEQIIFSLLLLVKSLAMTCGRIFGSFKNGVICI